MDPFLTRDEVTKLTGSPQKSKQVEWLRKERIAFRVSITGHPSVLWSAIDSTRRADPAPVAAWKSNALEAA